MNIFRIKTSYTKLITFHSFNLMEKEPQQLPMPDNLKSLSIEQQRQVLMQLEKHEHARYIADIALSETETLKDFVVYPEVLRPESMTSLFLARHLYKESN